MRALPEPRLLAPLARVLCSCLRAVFWPAVTAQPSFESLIKVSIESKFDGNSFV